VDPFRDKLGYWVERVAAGEEVIVTRHGRPRIRLSPAMPVPCNGSGVVASGPGTRVV